MIDTDINIEIVGTGIPPELLESMGKPGPQGYLFNTGGPRSRSRTEVLSASVLGRDDGAIQCPRVLRVGLDFGDRDPLACVRELLAACGYTLGATYPPSWMDWPMMWADNPQVIESGMVFFMHMILLDDRTGVSMSLGETAIVTKGKCELVNHAPRRLVVN